MLGVGDQDIYTLQRAVPWAKLDVRPFFKDVKETVVSFELDPKRNYDALVKIVSQIESKQYGFYCSLTTERDSDGLTVPSAIRNLIKQIGGSLDFSFTRV